MASLEPFDFLRLAETTAWNNNCSFNCLAHFLAAELEGATPADLQKLKATPSYSQILKLFSQYYQITPDISIEGLKKLLKEYPNPVDKEVIFGPVLRQYLVAELQKDWMSQDPLKMKYKEEFIDYLNDDIVRYLERREEFDKSAKPGQKFSANPKGLWHPDFITANSQKISDLYDEYLKQKASAPDLTIEKFMDKAKTRELLTTKNGHADYMSFLANNATLITVQELNLLTERMGIGLEVLVHREVTTRGPDGVAQVGIQVVKEELFKGARTADPDRVLRVFHQDNHWQFMAANSAIAASHNLVYENLKRIQRTFEATSENTEGQTSRAVAISLQEKSNPKFLSAHLPSSTTTERQAIKIDIQKDVQAMAGRIAAIPAVAEPAKTAETDRKAAVETDNTAKLRRKAVRFREEIEDDTAGDRTPKQTAGPPKKSILKKPPAVDEVSRSEAEPSIELSVAGAEQDVELIVNLEEASEKPEPAPESELEPEAPAATEPPPARMPFRGMYSAYQERAVREFQKPADAELRAKADSKEKIEASHQWLEKQIQEAHQKRNLDNPHPFENVTMKPGSTKEKSTLLVTRSDGGQPDSITRTVDPSNKVSVRLSHKSEDQAFVVMALANTHFVPLIMQKNNDPKKVLKTMEAFLHAGVPLNIGENKQHFEAASCPKELKEMYLLLSERDGEGFKEQLAALTPEDREKRRFGEPLKNAAVAEENLDTLTPKKR